MNTKYRSAPEVIASLRTVDELGNDNPIGDKVTGVSVSRNEQNGDGVVIIDVREFKRGSNLLIEIELQELSAALAMATLNSDRR